MKVFRYIFIALFLFLVQLQIAKPEQLDALSCAQTSTSPQERIDSSEYVFEGSVINRADKDQLVDPSEVAVNRVYKGDVEDKVTVQLSSMWDKVSLQADNTYLFLFSATDYDQSRNKFTRGLCDFQSSINTSDENYKSYVQILNDEKNSKYILFSAGAGTLLLAALSALFIISQRNKGAKKKSR